MMEYWGKGEAFVGSAGILPAAAGKLPGAFFLTSRHYSSEFVFSANSSCPAKCRTERATCPRSRSTFTIHDVTIHEVHAHRSHI